MIKVLRIVSNARHAVAASTGLDKWRLTGEKYAKERVFGTHHYSPFTQSRQRSRNIA